MADWSKPTITSNYILFVDEAKARDVDAITLQKDALVGPPLGSIKLLRAPVKFQEWSGSAFVDLVLSVAGGGTGSSTPAGAGSALGLGTMAYQNANAIAVTGGTIANITSGGAFTHQGVQVVILAPSAGYHSLVAYGSSSPGTYTAFFLSSEIPGSANCVLIQAGYNAADFIFLVRNRLATGNAIAITGDLVVAISTRLVIPVGVNLWAPA